MKHAIVMPWRLPESRKRDGMTLAGGVVRVLGLTNPWQYFLLKEASNGLGRLKHHRAHEHFAAISANHAYRSDLPHSFVHIEIRRPAKVDCGVCEISGPFSVMCES